MNVDNPIAVAVVGIVALMLIILGRSKFFSDDARWERRRRRSNAPISSRAKGPSIKFSVRTGKKGRK